MTAKNPDNEKQHYVPEVVLAIYAEGAGKNKLCVFDKHTGRTFPGPTAVKKLCKEGGFYNAEAAHGRVSLEKAFHQLEQEYRDITAKVIAKRSLAPLSREDFGTLVGFVCVQYLRVPRLRKAFEQFNRLIADKARAIAPKAESRQEFELGSPLRYLLQRYTQSLTAKLAQTTMANIPPAGRVSMPIRGSLLPSV